MYFIQYLGASLNCVCSVKTAIPINCFLCFVVLSYNAIISCSCSDSIDLFVVLDSFQLDPHYGPLRPASSFWLMKFVFHQNFYTLWLKPASLSQPTITHSGTIDSCHIMNWVGIVCRKVVFRDIDFNISKLLSIWFHL